jgi:hypothetical protein
MWASDDARCAVTPAGSSTPKPGSNPGAVSSPPGTASARVAAGNFSALSAQGKLRGGGQMATPERRSGIAGISVGGIIVIAGILMMLFWSLWIGLIVVLIGLIAFGGFARGKWY